MKKYITLLKLVVSQGVTYRLKIVFGILQSFLTPAFMLLALQFATPTGDLKTGQLLPYYVLISLVYAIVRSNVDELIDEMTASGEVNNFLLKPISFYGFMLVKEFGEGLITMITLSPFLVLAFAVFGYKLSIINILILLPAIVLAFLTYFNFSYLIGLVSFWVDEFWAIHNVKHVAIHFLGGIVLPYSFFPQSWVSFLQFTPFPYLTSWIVQIIQRGTTMKESLIVVSWIIILRILIIFFEKKAILKYSFTAN